MSETFNDLIERFKKKEFINCGKTYIEIIAQDKITNKDEFELFLRYLSLDLKLNAAKRYIGRLIKDGMTIKEILNILEKEI